MKVFLDDERARQRMRAALNVIQKLMAAQREATR